MRQWEEVERGVPFRELIPGGPWAGSGNRPMASPWPFLPFLFLFPFSFFVFLNCFKSFAKMLQTTSNKFLKSAKQPSKPIRNMFSETKQDFFN
jgi:hypothetical protein